jgi:hypothetical protein
MQTDDEQLTNSKGANCSSYRPAGAASGNEAGDKSAVDPPNCSSVRHDGATVRHNNRKRLTLIFRGDEQ